MTTKKPNKAPADEQTKVDPAAVLQDKTPEDQAEVARIAEEQKKAAEEKAEAEHLAEVARKEAEALDEANKQKTPSKIPALLITSKPDSFRRCGFRFSKQAIGIALDCLTSEQIDTLKNEPNLIIEECEVLWGELYIKGTV